MVSVKSNNSSPETSSPREYHPGLKGQCLRLASARSIGKGDISQTTLTQTNSMAIESLQQMSIPLNPSSQNKCEMKVIFSTLLLQLWGVCCEGTERQIERQQETVMY